MAKDPAVLLVPGVWRIPLLGDFVNGFAFRDADDRVTLLDMGLKTSGKKVVAALRWIGSDTSDVTRLLLTHAHSDHAGGAAYVAEQTGLGVGVHAGDASYARAGKAPPVMVGTRLGALLSRSNRFAPVPVDEELTDGQVLPVAGGLRVVHTPGHSPGHVSYLPRGLRSPGHRRRHLQRTAPPLAGAGVLHRLRDDQADRASPGGARLHHRRLHARPGAARAAA